MANFSPDIDKEYLESFGLVDKDNDGLISKFEFEELIKKTGMPNHRKMAEQLWAASKATSAMNVDQFKKAFYDTFVLSHKKAQILSAFETFDVEKTGKLHQEEVSMIFSQMGNQLDAEEIQDMIRIMEPGEDGKCDYRKFVDNMYKACREIA